MIVPAVAPNATYDFADDVRAGLSRPGQKELPSKYLYDDVGSALFEVISHLPEYGLDAKDMGHPMTWKQARIDKLVSATDF